MSLIQHAESLPAGAHVLFDLTQDYSRRTEWDPFPESYEFHEGATHAQLGVHLTVRARNGFRMRVKYVTFDPPRVAAIKMVTGPWFIRSFAGAWHFSPEADESTRVTFKYNVVGGPGIIGKLLQPFIDRSFSRHTKQRLGALKSYVERHVSGGILVRHEMKPDINCVLKVYLGADENGGYEPLYRDERMRQAFPDSYSQMMELIALYLEEDQVPDWTMGDLIQETNRFEARLRQKFPELDATAVRALANRWSFGWK